MSREVQIFVVPTDASNYLGWWMGEVVNINENFVQINIIWAEHPENKIDGLMYRLKKFLCLFATKDEAIDFLRGKGVKI